ncbi:MAG: putative toxin-antitoxin system toxin component, PIN family [Acidobacteria bacterium]|nr:putative toxin-antitoxin system toxin component, PIN family [Acidobacteriota bacterium]
MSRHRPRVVFDCMIFLQAAARRASPSGACLALAEQGLLERYVSPAILAEIQDVVSRPQVRTKFRQLTDDVAAEFVARIERVAVRVDEAGTSITLARDPKDEPYLNLAVHVGADFLVSRDRDLLESTYATGKTLPEVRIVDPVEFLAAVRPQLGNSS